MRKRERERESVSGKRERVMALFSGLFLNTASSRSSKSNNSAGVKKGGRGTEGSCGGEDFKVTLDWEQKDRGESARMDEQGGGNLQPVQQQLLVRDS